MITAKPGEFAYLETLRGGLVPCKVLEVYYQSNHRFPDWRLKIRITRSKAGYRTGEVLEAESPLHVLPRTALYKRRGEFFPRIRAYRWLPLQPLLKPNRERATR